MVHNPSPAQELRVSVSRRKSRG